MTYPRHPGIGHDRSGAWSEGLPLEPEHITMADFPRFEYSMHQVKKAGEALKGEIEWSEDRRDDLIEIFRIANNWLDSHAYPMVSLRYEAVGKMRTAKVSGLTVSRLKRMRSIRKKLRRITTKLDQIQDLGGCRIIVPSIADANTLVSAYRESPKHIFQNGKDYIAEPKVGGYRCRHLVYEFRNDGDAAVYNGRRVEIQIRTRLQHSWATAVEAVGLFRREDMKAGEGDQEWLRLFDLMSAELARAEGCPEASHLPPRYERVSELIDLNKKLNAVGTLESLRQAVRYTSTHRIGNIDPKYYRIEFDSESRQVNVTPHTQAISGISELHAVEQSDRMSGENKLNTVFVAADKIEDLKEAYPNYFGDVQLFNRNLKDITLGKDAKEYTMPPQETVPPPPYDPPDLSWFRPGRHRRWT